MPHLPPRLAKIARMVLGTLRGLSPERRAVFILRHVLGLSIETCAAVCDATASAMTVVEGRGWRDLEGYLGARCEHMDPGNACHCAARLGNALDRGLVRWPEHHEHDAAPLPGPTARSRISTRASRASGFRSSSRSRGGRFAATWTSPGSLASNVPLPPCDGRGS